MSVQRKIAAELLPALKEYGGGEVVRKKVGRCYREYWTAEISVKHHADPFPTVLKVAMNYKGNRIGQPNFAHRLAKRGITPELSDSSHTVCSVGKSHLDGKWYGWSHRAIYGFRAGDEVRQGDCVAEKLPIGSRAEDEDGARAFAAAFASAVG